MMQLVGGMVHRRSTQRATRTHERAHGNEGKTAAADTTSGKVARTLVMSPLWFTSGPAFRAWRWRKRRACETGPKPPRGREHPGTAAYRPDAGPSRDVATPDVRRWGH